ncbi:MAG TPA: nucleotide exchange factor GrpE [Chloroflexi bacterium]|nr:nucleotide exchange factor GrpE [Chloroflexota bacterium]
MADEKKVEVLNNQQTEQTQPQESELVLKEELEAARQEAAEYKDKYLRLLAERENYRKQVERIYKDRAEEEKKRLLRSFLTIADNLARALACEDDGDGLRQGVDLTYREFQRLLAQEGVEPIEAAGQPFDPYLHEAVEVVSDGGEPGTVLEEVERGYTYKGQVLRPAKVRVVKG